MRAIFVAVGKVFREQPFRMTPVAYKGDLPGYRLKRVLDYIAASLDGNIDLAQLSAIAGMSPHYFSELRTPAILPVCFADLWVRLRHGSEQRKLFQRCFRSRPMPVIKLRSCAFAAEHNFLERVRPT